MVRAEQSKCENILKCRKLLGIYHPHTQTHISADSDTPSTYFMSLWGALLHTTLRATEVEREGGRDRWSKNIFFCYLLHLSEEMKCLLMPVCLYVLRGFLTDMQWAGLQRRWFQGPSEQQGTKKAVPT